MDISISGQNINVGDSLSEYVTEKLEESITKYFPKTIFANAVFSKVNNTYHCKIYINEGTKTGVKVVGNAEGHEIYKVADEALEKVSKRLRRFHRHIKKHVRHDNDGDVINAMQFTIEYDKNNDEDMPDNPVIIAEEIKSIETMSVSEAVMRMDMESRNFFIFVNVNNNRINFLNIREDGNISWFDHKS